MVHGKRATSNYAPIVQFFFAKTEFPPKYTTYTKMA
jgi:hypothetical protein